MIAQHIHTLNTDFVDLNAKYSKIFKIMEKLILILFYEKKINSKKSLLNYVKKEKSYLLVQRGRHMLPKTIQQRN